MVCGRDDAKLLDFFFFIFFLLLFIGGFFLHLQGLLPLVVCRQGGEWRARVVSP